jgi:prepilin-type N-terminal cleavage/methylation domain-containing protein
VRRNGFTLVEILVAITIMGILISVATLNYSAMKQKGDIEKQTRELYSVIVGTRLSAMQNKQRLALFLGPKQYIFKQYTSVNDSIATAWKIKSTVNLAFPIQKLDTSGTLVNLDVATDKIDFDTNGFTNNNMTLVVTPVSADGRSNCLVVHVARTNIGRMDSANTCTIK